MRDVRPALFVVALAISWSAVADAQGTAYQVADIGPNEPADSVGGVAYPINFQPVSNGDVYLALAGTRTPSLWRTDGTANGTQPLFAGVDALMGSNGQRAYFTARGPGGSTALWATDGTQGGTVLLKAIPGLAAGVVLEGRLFFHDCFERCELWTSDSTIEGTRKLVELDGFASRLASSGGVVYFVVRNGELKLELWKTDGTAEGTIHVRTFSSVGQFGDVASVNGRALVLADGKLWATNGSIVDPVVTLGDHEYVDFLGAALDGSALYFRGGSRDGTVFTVWRSDGTASGTSTVLRTPGAFGMLSPWVQRHGSRVYYLIPGAGARAWSYSLWSSDLQGQGAQPVACGGGSSVPEEGWILVAGGELYFPAASGNVHTL